VAGRYDREASPCDDDDEDVEGAGVLWLNTISTWI
jgi:hypothetical protein